MPEDQTKYLKYILNKWITRGIKKAGGRGQGAQSSEHRAQGTELRAQGKKSVGGSGEQGAQGMERKMQGREQGGKFQIF